MCSSLASSCPGAGHAAGTPPGRRCLLTAFWPWPLPRHLHRAFMGAALVLPSTCLHRRRWPCLLPGLGMALPYLLAACARGALAAAPRRVDGHLPPRHGLPHVCHRGVAGVVLGQQTASTARAPCWRCWWRGSSVVCLRCAAHRVVLVSVLIAFTAGLAQRHRAAHHPGR